MVDRESMVVYHKVLIEQNQGHETRQEIFEAVESKIGRPLVTFFTSFRFPVMIEDPDVDMLEGVLQKMDLSKGLALFINSPGGDGVAAERIINVCRNYSKTGEYWAIVQGKAKSAATMICFGASKILMGATAELGPIDPQVAYPDDRGSYRRCSVYSIIKSYENLFARSVKEKGNLDPYLLQLHRYDEREIEQFRGAISLSEDIAVRSLESGMMKGATKRQIKQRIQMFLTPERTKTHSRPIYMDEARSCTLNVEVIAKDTDLRKLLYELYIRTNNFVSSKVQKCIESKVHSFALNVPESTVR